MHGLRLPKLTQRDKSVIQDFVDKRQFYSKKLLSNSEALECKVTKCFSIGEKRAKLNGIVGFSVT
jgi:hypothetical protein